MAAPKSVMKMNKKDGVTFKSSVDRTQYCIFQLTRAAMKDVGKFVARETKQKIKKNSGRLAKNVAWKVPFSKVGLPFVMVGFKPGGFYGGFEELGTKKKPKQAALYNSVAENIAMIIRIQSQYLSGLESEAKALSLIDEGEGESE